jgi:uncharacterized protein
MSSATISVKKLTAPATDEVRAAALRKQEALLRQLGALDSLLVAYSGGVDSAYLAWAAHRALGTRALAVTAISASFSVHDRAQAERCAREAGFAHEFISTDEFSNPLYVANNADRCYHCKTELFDALARLAAARGFAAIAYGINADDTSDFRPGHRAAAEHRVLAPLLDAQLSKAEIRALAADAGLTVWDRPASACLSSRVPYGIAVTPDVLAKIEQGEAVLRELGFRQFRVRYHNEMARLEIARDEMARALQPATAAAINARLKALGFSFVTLDLEGYRQGSLNAALKKPAAG